MQSGDTFISALMDQQKDYQAQPVMTVEEVAEYLRIPISSVYKLAREKVIPAQKVGRHWRFHREAIERWLMHGNPTT